MWKKVPSLISCTTKNVAKIKAEKAYEFVGWALPTYPSLSKMQDVRSAIAEESEIL